MRDKRKKFIELAEKRVETTIDKLRLIGNLSDNRYYDYTNEDVKQILTALTEELDSVKQKFGHSKKNHKGKGFKLEV